MEDCAAAMASRLQQGERKTTMWKWLLGRGVSWLFVMYPTRHLRLSHPRAEGLLIKPKLDTGSNYCIGLRLALIQGLVLSVCFEGSPAAEGGSKGRNGQLCIVCNASHCDYCSGGSGDSIQHPQRETSQSIVIKAQQY